MAMRKPDVRPGLPCEFPGCASGKCAVHGFQGRALCAYHSPYDVDWSEYAEEEHRPMEPKEYDTWFELWGYNGSRWEFIADFDNRLAAEAHDEQTDYGYEQTRIKRVMGQGA